RYRENDSTFWNLRFVVKVAKFVAKSAMVAKFVIQVRGSGLAGCRSAYNRPLLQFGPEKITELADWLAH
ncbi:hypothetical protein AVEN_171920-1, partial [Araneus ventricosus]